MKRTSWISMGVLTVLLTGILIVCSKTSDAADKVILVGAPHSQTGSLAVYGERMVQGIRLAEKEINDSGGISGAKLKVVFYDDRSDKSELINVLDKLIHQDKVIALIGPSSSGTAFTAAPMANENKIPLIVNSGTAAGIPQIGPYVFRNSLPEYKVINTVLARAVKNLGIKTVAIIYGSDDEYTKGGYNTYKDACATQGIKIVGTESYVKGTTDFSAQLTKINATKPDALIVSALSNESANILVQARKAGIPESVHFLGTNGFNSVELYNIAGKSAEGAVSGTAWLKDRVDPKNKKFVQAYNKMFGKDPDSFAAQAYDAVFILKAAIERAKTYSDREAIRNALAQTKNFKGVTNPLSFDKDRDSVQNGIVVIVKNGKQVEWPVKK